jgi:hypothetical protein
MRKTLSIAILALVLAAGCHKQQQQPSAMTTPAVSSQPTPEQLGEIGAEIKKAPAKADEILASHGMDEKSFEAAIRKVTENPAASRRYATAFKKASA